MAALLAGATFSWLRPATATQKLIPGGIRLEFNYRYPPTASEVTNLQKQVERAQKTYCDMTDGVINLKEIWVTVGDSKRETGDVWLFPDIGRSFATFGGHVTLRPGFAKDGSRIYEGQTIAHELGHLILGVGDEYDEQNRIGSGCGIGPNFSSRPGDTPVDIANNSVMQDSVQECRLVSDGRRISDLNPHWFSLRCADDSDCTRPCLGPGCPAANNLFECSPTPTLASEITIGVPGKPGNFD